MAVGTSTYRGLAVPLNGEVELRQDTAAIDFITLTGDASISGDYLVCRTGSTEVFVINSAGAIAAGSITTGVGVAGLRLDTLKSLKFSAPYTTALPTTGLAKGEMFLVIQSGTPQLAVQIAGASTVNVLRYFTANTATFGRSSAS